MSFFVWGKVVIKYDVLFQTSNFLKPLKGLLLSMLARAPLLRLVAALFLLSHLAVYVAAQPTYPPTHGLSPLNLDPDCSAFGLHKRPAGEPVRIYDVFMFNTELDVLEIRFEELWPLVDYFVVAESGQTHSGKAKSLYFSEHRERFAKYESKVIHIVLDNIRVEGGDANAAENSMRQQACERGLSVEGKKARKDDLVIIGDVDEIPSANQLAIPKSCKVTTSCVELHGKMFYYSYSTLVGGWDAQKLAVYDGTFPVMILNTTVDKGRYMHGCGLVIPGTRHCSYCFATVQQYINKLRSFLHTELSGPEHTNPPNIVEKVTQGIDLFGRSKEPFARTNYWEEAPRAVLRNPARYHYMLTRQPHTGSLSDFEAYRAQQQES